MDAGFNPLENFAKTVPARATLTKISAFEALPDFCATTNQRFCEMVFETRGPAVTCRDWPGDLYTPDTPKLTAPHFSKCRPIVPAPPDAVSACAACRLRRACRTDEGAVPLPDGGGSLQQHYKNLRAAQIARFEPAFARLAAPRAVVDP